MNKMTYHEELVVWKYQKMSRCKNSNYLALILKD